MLLFEMLKLFVFAVAMRINLFEKELNSLRKNVLCIYNSKNQINRLIN